MGVRETVQLNGLDDHASCLPLTKFLHIHPKCDGLLSMTS